MRMRTKRNANGIAKSSIIIFLAIGVMVDFGIYNSNVTKAKRYNTMITKAQKDKNINTKFNESIDAKNKLDDLQVGNTEIKKNADIFLDAYFKWNTWVGYSKNMELVRNEFPELISNKNVDISGNNVGTGNSPSSTYEVEYYQTENRGQIIGVINQKKGTYQGETKVTWVGDFSDLDKLDVNFMEQYIPG